MFLAKLKKKLAAQHQGTDATATSDSATPGETDGISFGKTEDHIYALPEGYTFSRKGHYKRRFNQLIYSRHCGAERKRS